MGLLEYREKRNFRKTPEPSGARDRRKSVRAGKGSLFVVQKHDASHLHYDFRLELDGTLKSWAVPKGPSYDPTVKRLAMQVEDHPISYASFEGVIPEGEYGGGEVIVWDTGKWVPVGDPGAGYRKGRLEFELKGKKLKGRWILFRIRGFGERAQWFLVKREDALAHPSPDPHPIVEERPESVLSRKYLSRDLKARGLAKGKTIAKGAKVWRSNRAEPATKAKSAAKKASPRKAAAPKAVKKKAARGALGFVEPELATLVERPPTGERWLHEIKFDGYRTLVQVQRGAAPKFMTRKGLDWTARYPSLVGEFSAVEADSALIDGEIVALDAKGRSDFGALQSALKNGGANLFFYAFDLLELDDVDLRPLPLEERKERLAALLAAGEFARLRYSDHWEGSASRMLAKGCELGLEGVISKDRHAPYASGRGGQWLKSKCRQGFEVVVVGFTPPDGARKEFGSLVLAAHDENGEYRYLGRIGTGFTQSTLAEVARRMKPLYTDRSPFAKRVPLDSRIQWLEPKLVAEIDFHGWTPDGRVRQGVFRALREDKPAEEVKVDRPVAPKEAENAVTLTHPEKILIPEGKVTKRAVRDYLVAAADWILPHLIDRPLALVRCPDDTHHECFFQKQLMPGKTPGLKPAKAKSPKGKTNPILYLESKAGLESLAQMGALEIHPWGTHRQHQAKPDLLVFDLDPGEGVAWSKVADAALRLREILDGLGLRSFLKVSGNKGLHIHVPIEPDVDWETGKAFANAVALLMAKESPELYVATMTKAKRKGKIFIDFFRNGYGNTSVAPYSLRAKNGGAVALPIEWKDVRKVDPRGFRIADVRRLLARRKPGGRGDPWRDYFKTRQRLPKEFTAH